MAAPAAAENPLLGDASLRRRRLVNRSVEAVSTLAAMIAVAVLGIVIVSVAVKGASAISLEFITKTPQPFSGGGIANAIVGTAILIGLAALMAVPVGILVGIYTSEYARPSVASAISFALDILNGVPTIVVGIFVFGLLVAGHQQSGWAGAFALAIIMLPIVGRSAHEVLRLVPLSLKEASLALGVRRWRTLLTVVLPSAAGGLLTGALLAVARVAGETAPLLYTTSIASNSITTSPSQALPAMTIKIFELSEAPEPAAHAQAWAASLLLIAGVLLLSVIARAIHARVGTR
jgi:phosphate transport system permease protein